MLGYILSILGLVGLITLWAIFQLWMNKRDPDREEHLMQCSGCDKRCEWRDEEFSPGPHQTVPGESIDC